ncbi:MAG TPA: N-formylglutamate amidohydrolase [Myxococcota bacterium]|nr:N-formylglutamate amidohydrolase [Myxococcota bacterium]
MSELIPSPYSVQRGDGPLVATAIHDGHDLRPEVQEHLAIEDQERRREEDPFTGLWTGIVPNRLVVSRSRFEVDLNRPREKAVYRTPDDAWGLKVWKRGLPDAVASRSLQIFDSFYHDIGLMFGDLAARNGRFFVFDLHSYNQLRYGPHGPPAGEAANPQVNVGTGTMPDRGRWAAVIDGFIDALRGFEFPTGPLDVRENVKFRGGEFGRWAHATFPDSACVLSIEFKKFFMDEWTGRHDPALVAAIGMALRSTIPRVLDAIAGLR